MKPPARTIWKFPFVLEDRVTLNVPESAEARSVGLDPEHRPCVWCEVSDAPTADLEHQRKKSLTLFIVGTGDPIPEVARTYLGLIIHGPFVWHFYTT